MEIKDGVRIRGIYDTECWRVIDGSILPSDTLKWVFSKRRQQWELRRLVWHDKSENLVVTEGLNALLNIMFHASTQITTWYCCLVETNTSPAAGMTYAVPSYTESTSYDEATRPAYVEAAASGGSITNSASKAVFTISATKTMYGASLVGGGSAASTKGDTAGGGTLYNYSLFAVARAVVDDDIINLTVTLTEADDAV